MSVCTLIYENATHKQCSCTWGGILLNEVNNREKIFAASKTFVQTPWQLPQGGTQFVDTRKTDMRKTTRLRFFSFAPRAARRSSLVVVRWQLWQGVRIRWPQGFFLPRRRRTPGVAARRPTSTSISNCYNQ